MNHFYENIQGWSHYLSPLYLHLVPVLPANPVIAEVGVWKGRSTAYLAVELYNANKQFHIHAVDSWQGCTGRDLNFYDSVREQMVDGSIRREFEDNLKSFKENLTVHQKTSVEAAAEFDDQSLDMVVIDDDHEYESVLASIQAWAPKIKPGGILCGDDHDSYYPGVGQALNEVFGTDYRLYANGQEYEASDPANAGGGWYRVMP